MRKVGIEKTIIAAVNYFCKTFHNIYFAMPGVLNMPEFCIG